MSTFKTLTGSPAPGIGIAILDDAGQINFLDNAASTARPNTSSPKVGASGDIFVCGNNTNGVAIAVGNSVKYLTNLGNDSASWKTVQQLETGVTAGGIAGDNVNGFTVINSTGDKIYQLSSVDSKAEWKLIAPPAPFSASKVAGDNKVIVIIGRGDDRDRVARTSDCCTWATLAGVPFRIDLICGNSTGGFVVYGEGQLAQLDPAKWTFTPLPRPNFAITAMSGNPKDGIVALVGNGDVVAYCGDVTKTAWTISMIPKPPAAAQPAVQPAAQPAAQSAAQPA